MASTMARIAEIRGLMQPTGVAASLGTGTAATSDSGRSFAAALSEATASTDEARRSGSSVAALKDRFSNGKIPADALTPIGRSGHRLAAPAAAAFAELEAAARRDGVRFGVTDSYRSYDQQVDLVQRKGLYSQGGLAAEPGTSQHGWGLAVDLDLDARAQAWMRANGPKYGFVEDTPREPWHWAYKG